MNPTLHPAVEAVHLVGHPHREAERQARRYQLVRAVRAERRARRAVHRAHRAAEQAGLAPGDYRVLRQPAG